MSEQSRRQTARTLLVLAGAVLVTGAAVMSPAGALFCGVVSGLAALGAVPLAGRRARIAALILLALAAAMGMYSYPQYRSELQRIQ